MQAETKEGAEPPPEPEKKEEEDGELDLNKGTAEGLQTAGARRLK